MRTGHHLAIVRVESTATGDSLDVGWVVDGGAVAVDLATGATPDASGHVRRRTLDAGVTATRVATLGSGRTFVSVTPRGGRPVVAADRLIPFGAASNFRDLGGYATRDGRRTRWGSVFRSDALHGFDVADLDLFESLGIRTVFDLRSDAERAARPNSMPSIDRHISSRVDVGAPPQSGRVQLDGLTTSDDGESMMRDVYTGLVRVSAASIGSLLTELAVPAARPTVFHCHAGKDRTGIVAAVLLLALGVDREVVLDDYELSGRYWAPTSVRSTSDRLVSWGATPEAAAAVVGVQRRAMASALDIIGSDGDDVDRWLVDSAGMSSRTIDLLRSELVEADDRDMSSSDAE